MPRRQRCDARSEPVHVLAAARAGAHEISRRTSSGRSTAICWATYPEIGEAIADRVFEEIPGYGSAAPELVADLRVGATATVEVLACVRRGLDATPGGPRVLA